MKMYRTILALVAFSVLFLPALACGGSPQPTPTPTKTPGSAITATRVPLATAASFNEPATIAPTVAAILSIDTATPVPVIVEPTATAIPIPDTPTPMPPIEPTAMPERAVEAIPLAPAGPVCECGADTYKCDDFPNQASAQACFAYCNDQGAGDIHRLDRDNNGFVCEDLP